MAQKIATAPARFDVVAGQEAKALIEPLNDAMGKLLPVVEKYWKRNAKKGQKFYVVFNGGPKDIDERMYSVFKKECTTVKLETKTAQKASFRVQCKKDNMELSMAIKEGIKAKVDGADFEWAVKTRSALVVQFK